MNKFMLKISMIAIIMFASAGHNFSCAMMAPSYHREVEAIKFKSAKGGENFPDFLKLSESALKAEVKAEKADKDKKILENEKLFQQSLKMSELDDSIGSFRQKEIRANINKLQEKRAALLRSLPREEAVDVCKKQLQKMKELCAENERNAFYAVKTAYDIDDATWKKEIQSAKERRTSFLENATSDSLTCRYVGEHDSLVCSQWVKCLATAMEKDRIKIKRMDLTCNKSESGNGFASFGTGHSAYGVGTMNLDEEANSFYKKLLADPSCPEPVRRKAMAMLGHAAYHETTHARKGHNFYDGAILRAIKSQSGSQKDILELKKQLLQNKNSAYARYHSRFEQTADVDAAFTNPRAAEAGVLIGTSDSVMNFFIPIEQSGALYPGSYAILRTAYANWKFIEKCENKSGK